MDLDGDVIPLVPGPAPVASILCHNCGAPVDGSTAINALCRECLALSIDATAGLPRETVLHTCGDCDRWLAPPANQWIVAHPESRELLALCLKKLRGLSRMRVIDASFVWTEPHSRRLKVKITIQQALGEAIVQQAFEVEYVIANQQCPDCKKSYTHHTWRAVVQVRQKVAHKRTFLFLEQLILRNGAHKDTINIKEMHDGIDFFFAQRNQAEKFVDFLASVAPVHVKKSQELISMDVHTSTKSYKFTFSVEIVPVCKDDLVALPVKLAQQLGNISPLVLCQKIGTAVSLLDPTTLQTSDLTTKQFWHTPFQPLAEVQSLGEFVVLDIDPLGPERGNLVLAEATVSPASDMDRTYYVRTHLGGVLHPGDTVLGYHLSGANYNNAQFDALEGSKSHASRIPDVVLVKKFYPRQRRARGRNWRLRRMAGVEESEDAAAKRNDKDKVERDYEMFLRDVEEDKEFRAGFALYKARREAERMEVDRESEGGVGDDEQEDEEDLKIPMDELLEEFEEMNMDDGGEEL